MDAADKPVILTYHSISNGRSPLEISPALFAEQMEWLKKNASVAPLASVVNALVQRKPLPERTLALTFDDGFLDFHTHAAPVLLRLNLPAIVFLPIAHVGGRNDWAGQPTWVTKQLLMDWPQVRELADQGICFGSHSVSHADLTALAPTELKYELEKSKREIELRVNRAVDFLCYPYGRWNADVRAVVARNYRGACSTGAGVVEPDADPFALPRVDAHYVRHPRWFQCLFTRRFEAYIAARRMIRRLRGQPEGAYSRV